MNDIELAVIFVVSGVGLLLGGIVFVLTAVLAVINDAARRQEQALRDGVED